MYEDMSQVREIQKQIIISNQNCAAFHWMQCGLKINDSCHYHYFFPFKDHAKKTVTVEAHPHLPMTMASVHPCR